MLSGLCGTLIFVLAFGFAETYEVRQTPNPNPSPSWSPNLRFVGACGAYLNAGAGLEVARRRQDLRSAQRAPTTKTGPFFNLLLAAQSRRVAPLPVQLAARHLREGLLLACSCCLRAGAQVYPPV